MRYKLDESGYVIAVSFGCYLEGCTEYTGTIPIGYNSLDDWATYSCINAYYIDHNGNLALDQEKLAECRRKEAQDKVDNAPVVRKDLYESEEVLESQYIKATVTGQTINLTDAKVLPPRIKLTGVDPSAYSDIILYVSNGTDTREYTILLDELETVDYILIEKGLVIACVNGNEEIIGEGHIRLFEGVCNIYASEVVTIEIEYSTNVQDVESLEFLQGKETTSNKFRILPDGSIEAQDGLFSGKVTGSSFEATGSVTKYASDYTENDRTIARGILDGTIECTPEHLEKYDFNGDGVLSSIDYVVLSNLLSGATTSRTLNTSILIDPLNSTNILSTEGVSIRPNGIYGKSVSGQKIIADAIQVKDILNGTYASGLTGNVKIGDVTLQIINGVIVSYS